MGKKSDSNQHFLIPKKELKEAMTEVFVPLFADINKRTSREELKKTMKEVVVPLFDDVNKRIDGLDKKFDKGIDGLDKKFDKRIDGLDKKFDKRMDDLEVSVAAIHQDFSVYKNETTNNFDYLFKKMDDLENEYHILHFHMKDWDVLRRDTRHNREKIEKIEVQVKELCNKI